MNTALARAPSPVFIEYVKGENNDIVVRCAQLGIAHQQNAFSHVMGWLGTLHVATLITVWHHFAL